MKLNLNLYKGQINEISVVLLYLFFSFCMFRLQLVKFRVKILNINLGRFKYFKSILNNFK